MVSKKKYSKKRNTKRRFKNQKGFKKQKGSKKKIRKYKGGKAIPPEIISKELFVESQAPIIPMNVGEEVVPEPVPQDLNNAFIENSFEEEEDNENNDDNNVFGDLNTGLHPQELGLEGGSKKSSFKSTFKSTFKKSGAK